MSIYKKTVMITELPVGKPDVSVTIGLASACLLTAFIFFCLGIYSLVVNNQQDKQMNKSMTYQYLEKQHCWTGIFKTTKYTLHPQDCGKTKENKYFGITRSGHKAIKDFTIAVDPKVVPLGSILIDVETGIKYWAMDTGSGVKGYHVDIFIGEGTIKNREETDQWGVKQRMFIVIE